VAALHTDSWRRHYRGLYSNDYLDGDLAADRLQIWTDRLADRDPLRHTILAEDGHELVGFAHTVSTTTPPGARCSTTCTSSPAASAPASARACWRCPRRP